MPITGDMKGPVSEVVLPMATPRVVRASRTFWEMATAAPVLCVRVRLLGERFALHWHDLTAIARSAHSGQAIAHGAVAKAVAARKSCFVAESDVAGTWIDCDVATNGGLQIEDLQNLLVLRWQTLAPPEATTLESRFRTAGPRVRTFAPRHPGLDLARHAGRRVGHVCAGRCPIDPGRAAPGGPLRPLTARRHAACGAAATAAPVADDVAHRRLPAPTT